MNKIYNSGQNEKMFILKVEKRNVESFKQFFSDYKEIPQTFFIKSYSSNFVKDNYSFSEPKIESLIDTESPLLQEDYSNLEIIEDLKRFGRITLTIESYDRFRR